MEQVSCRLTIFEGPDGSGKSTAAHKFAKDTNARYVHFPALPRVSAGLARMYVEAMMPALLGYQDVVFDRCWMSETPYGVAFREGQDRLGDPSRRMLERLALRCGAVMVRCNPGWDAVLKSYLSRKHLEMLENDGQLHQVFDLYAREHTDLPEVEFDYTRRNSVDYDAIEAARTPRHPLALQSAGNLNANVVLVGEAFAERKDCDPFYQWPFASFSNAGCSQWLSRQLDAIDCGEQDLLWMNADQDLSILHDLQPGKVIALGDAAYQQLYKLKIMAESVPHPQAFKRFNHRQRYPLLNVLQETAA
jgi:hypothetical protein